MSRSLKKGPFIDPKLTKKVAALGAEDRTIIGAVPGPRKGIVIIKEAK